MTTLDARGVSCPEPLLMLKSALKTQTSLTLLVDSKAAHEHCESFAKKQGLAVEVELVGDTFTLRISAS